MRDMFSVSRELANADQGKREAEERAKEAQSFDLVPAGGFPEYAKYALFTLMGALNVRLFLSVVGGWWGLAIAADAILFELFALYCWHNLQRSSGVHRRWMLRIAVIFTFLSILHALASFYELIQAFAGLPALGRPLYFYSHVVAFPLLFISMICAAAKLVSTHPAREIAQAQANTQLELEKGRAEIVGQTAKMRGEAELSRAWLQFYEEKLETERKFLDFLRRVVSVEAEKAQLLGQISDPTTRKRMEDLLGRDANRDGTPDILQNADLQRQFLEAWQNEKKH